MSAAPRFPASLNPLPNGGVMDEYYVHQHLVLSSKGHNIAGTVCRAFQDKFELTLDGKTVIPIVFGPQVPDTRSLITKVMGWDHPPVIAHTPMTGQGYLVKGNAEEARNIFPGDNIEDVGNGWQLVRRQPREPVYSERSGASTQLIDHREKLVSQNLLAPQSRAALERHGKIVHESDSRHANKMTVGIKHFHGYNTSYLEYLAFDPELAEAFRKHQDEVCSMQREMLGLNPKMQTYIETFYEQQDPTQAAEAKGFFSESDVQVHNIDQFRRRPNLMSPTAVELFECEPAERIVANSVRSNSLDNIRGDGRMRYAKDEAVKLKNLNTDKARYGHGGIGVATDLAKRQGQRNEYVFDTSHQELIIRMNQQINEGQTAMVVYGGGHFETGYRDENPHRKLLEEYTALLPRFQLVVVEPHSYEVLKKREKEFWDALKKFPEKQRIYFVFLREKMEELRHSMKVAILTAKIGEIPALDTELRKTVEEMRLLFHPKSESAKAPEYSVKIYPVDSTDATIVQLPPHDAPPDALNY